MPTPVPVRTPPPSPSPAPYRTPSPPGYNPITDFVMPSGNGPSSFTYPDRSPPSAPTTAPTSTGPETVTQDGFVWQKVPNPNWLGPNDKTNPPFVWSSVGKAPSASDNGPRGSYHNDALQAATAAMSSFLQAQSLSDARRLSAMDEVQKLSSFALPAGSKTAPGYEAGGMGQQLAAMQGRTSYTPPPISTLHIDPSQLMNPAQIDPTVLAMIEAIKGAANQGQVS